MRKTQRAILLHFDFDGTITDGGDLTVDFFELIKLCQQNQVELIINTGRSISWAHFLLTHFSFLKIVISEGGGAISWRDDHGEVWDHLMASKEEISLRKKIDDKLLEKFPFLRFSRDSVGRVVDHAIELFDFFDHSSLKDVEDEKLKNQKITKTNLFQTVGDFLQQEGASFSSSNVHLNYWVGDISKSLAADYVLLRFFSGKYSRENCLYFGDSLNDQEMFKHYPYTVGVSNLKKYWAELSIFPTWCLQENDQRSIFGVLSFLKTIWSYKN